jgi:hypothetical protein
VSAVNEMPLGSSRVQPKAPNDMETCLGARFVGKSYVANVSKHWHLLSAEGRTTKSDGLLSEIRMGHATCNS